MDDEEGCAPKCGSNPTFQLIMLFITLAASISSVVLAQQSYDTLEDAVGKFEQIFDYWAVKPLTALEVKSAGSSCSTGYEYFSNLNSPSASGFPCACPKAANQPFNYANDTEITATASAAYPRNRQRKDSGAWETSYCETTKTSAGMTSYADQQIIGRRRRNKGSGVSYEGTTLNGNHACTDDGYPTGNDLSYGGSCSVAVSISSTSASVSCTYNTCWVETTFGSGNATRYWYDTYTTTCHVISIQSSTTDGCNRDQHMMRCLEDLPTSEFNMHEWRNKVICAKRNGQEAVSRSGSVRPDPDPDCPSGYDKCGSGNYNDQKASCVPSGSACPLTNVMIYDTTSLSYQALDWASVMPLSGNYVLVSRNASTTSNTELPVTSTFLGFGQKGINCGTGLNGYGASGSKNALSWTVNYGDKCSSNDTRWTKMDERPSADFLQDNFDTQCGSSSNTLLHWSDLTPVTERDGQSSYIKGVRADTFTSNNDSAAYCETGDAICNQVMNRTLCTKLSAWASSSSNNDVKANPYWMEEIFYKIEADKCATKRNLYDSNPIINDAKDAIFYQLVLEYCGIAVGTSLELLLICLGFQKQSGEISQGEHSTQAGCLIKLKRVFDILVRAADVIVIITVLMAVNNMGNVFKNADECTDSISATSGGFITLANTVDDVKENSFTTIGLQSFLLVVSTCLMFIQCNICGGESDKGPSVPTSFPRITV